MKEILLALIEGSKDVYLEMDNCTLEYSKEAECWLVGDYRGNFRQARNCEEYESFEDAVEELSRLLGKTGKGH